MLVIMRHLGYELLSNLSHNNDYSTLPQRILKFHANYLDRTPSFHQMLIHVSLEVGEEFHLLL